MLRKNQITNEAMKILERAAQHRHLGFRGSEEYKKCYMEFCEATGNRDTSAERFKVYVLKFGVRDKMIYTKGENEMVDHRGDMERKLDEYREDMIGRYYANR